MILRLAGYTVDSIVDGPGIRLAIFLQGCSHCCPGCHNPETQDPRGGQEVALADLTALIDRYRHLDGVTISGGEPFDQAAGAAALAAVVKAGRQNLVIYSGYRYEDLLLRSRRDQAILSLLDQAWLLIDGPYLAEQRDLNLAFRGSSNQRIIDLPLSQDGDRAVIWQYEY